MQSQRNSIKDGDNIESLLTHIKIMQITIEVEILASDEMALSTKSVISEKGVNISIRKVSYITNSFKTDGYLYEKTYNCVRQKKCKGGSSWES